MKYNEKLLEKTSRAFCLIRLITRKIDLCSGTLTVCLPHHILISSARTKLETIFAQYNHNQQK